MLKNKEFFIQTLIASVSHLSPGASQMWHKYEKATMWKYVDIREKNMSNDGNSFKFCRIDACRFTLRTFSPSLTCLSQKNNCRTTNDCWFLGLFLSPIMSYCQPSLVTDHHSPSCTILNHVYQINQHEPTAFNISIDINFNHNINPRQPIHTWMCNKSTSLRKRGDEAYPHLL